MSAHCGREEEEAATFVDLPQQRKIHRNMELFAASWDSSPQSSSLYRNLMPPCGRSPGSAATLGYSPQNMLVRRNLGKSAAR
jgi:hypothetical protein